MKYKPFMGLSNVTTDVCKYLDSGNSMIVEMFVDELKQHSNLIHACPFKVITNKIHFFLFPK